MWGVSVSLAALRKGTNKFRERHAADWSDMKPEGSGTRVCDGGDSMSSSGRRSLLATEGSLSDTVLQDGPT
jgi:hypothetical protein